MTSLTVIMFKQDEKTMTFAAAGKPHQVAHDIVCASEPEDRVKFIRRALMEYFKMEPCDVARALAEDSPELFTAIERLSEGLATSKSPFGLASGIDEVYKTIAYGGGDMPRLDNYLTKQLMRELICVPAKSRITFGPYEVVVVEKY